MGQGLYESEPVFKGAMDRCEAVYREVAGREKSLLAVMHSARGEKERDRWDSSKSLINETQYSQPCWFALEWSLAVKDI